jgi:hypothetical protein
MSRSIVGGILVALVVLVGLGSLGLVAYNAGVAQGLTESGKVALPAAPAGPAAVAPWYAYPHGWGFGFGPLGCLLPLILILCFFMIFRMAVWGMWGSHLGSYGHRRIFGHQDGERGVPPFFETWHNRAHGEPEPGSGKESGSS